MEIDKEDFIRDFAKEQGAKIANAIMLISEEYPYLVGKKQKPKGFLNDITKGFRKVQEERRIKEEIYERALHEATAFFLKNGDLKFDNEIIKIIKACLYGGMMGESVIYTTNLDKLTPEELLAELINISARYFLFEKHIVCLYGNFKFKDE